MVKIIVNNIHSKIVGFLPPEVHKDLDRALSYRLKNARHIPAVKQGRWDGVFHLYQKARGQSFYTGLLSFVREIFKKHNVEYQLQDARVVPSQNLPDLIFNPPEDWGYEERDYQTFTIDRSVKFTRGILSVCTGGGKTVLITKTISKIKTAPFIFYVLTKDLMEQAYRTMTACLNEPIGRVGDGICDIKNINVCTIQTAMTALKGKDKIKISDYKFDEEDVWDEKKIESQDKLDQIKALITQAKGIYFDECITGDSMLLTEKGEVRIDEVEKNNCRYVLSYDGINIVYNKIVKWMPKGVQNTIRLKYENGEIKCTTDHLMYTNRGWIQAGKLVKGERVLFANADAEHGSNMTDMAGKENLFSVIKLKEEIKKNGNLSLIDILGKLPYANVDVKEKSSLHTTLLSLSSIQEELLDTLNISKAMTSNQYIVNTILPSLKKNMGQLWERVWEILPCSFQIKDLETIDSVLLMGYAKKSGLNINLLLLKSLESLLEQLKMLDMEIIQNECGQDAYHALQKFQELYTQMEKRKCRKNGLTLSEMLDSLGGSATMEVILTVECLLRYILRDLVRERMKLSQDGLMGKAFLAESQKAKDITIFYLMLKALLKSKRSYKSMFPPVCSTSWKTVLHITEYRKEDVYDIEVKDTHCFFANGVLVHNCHHTAAKTCKEILEASKNAYWRFGGSATPYREAGDEIMIQAMFGAKIVNISASYLIKKGVLVKPYIFIVPIDSKGDWHSYPKIYKNCIVDNDELNDNVAEVTNHVTDLGLSCLVLVQHYPQGNYLKKKINNVEFVTGKLTTKDRTKFIDDLRDGETKAMIATSLADEGLDVPTLDVAILAGGGASITRVNQRIGRTLRKDREGRKERAIVIIYEHNAKFLADHAKKVRRILKKEPEFEVINSKGLPYLCEEIDELLGISTEPTSLFDV